MHPCAPPQDPVPLASNLLSFAAIARRSTSQTGRLLAAVLEHTTLASFDSDTAKVTAEDIGSCPCSMRPSCSFKGVLAASMVQTDCELLHWGRSSPG